MSSHHKEKIIQSFKEIILRFFFMMEKMVFPVMFFSSISRTVCFPLAYATCHQGLINQRGRGFLFSSTLAFVTIRSGNLMKNQNSNQQFCFFYL